MVYNLRIFADSVRWFVVTPEQRDAIVNPVRKGLGDLITGNPGLFFDRPGFIAGGGPSDPFSNVVRDLTRLNCRIWASRDKSGYSPRVNSGNAALCNPYLDDIGEKPPDGEVAPPFPGGQCLGTVYNVTGFYKGDSTNNQDQQFGPAAVNGAVTGVEARPNFFNPLRSDIWITSSTGPDVRVVQDIFSGGLSFRITSVVRLSGNPDVCGDPPAEYTPPGQSTPAVQPPPGITVDFPGLGPIGVTVTVGPDGDPTFCIPAIDTCIEVDVGNGEDGTGGGGPDVAPTTPGSPAAPTDTGVGGEAGGEAGEGEELTGVLVRVLQRPVNANKFDNTPFDVLRGAGYVAMGYPGLLGIDPTASVLNSPQFFHAQQRGLTAWRVRANIGFNLESTPYYREIES